MNARLHPIRAISKLTGISVDRRGGNGVARRNNAPG